MCSFGFFLFAANDGFVDVYLVNSELYCEVYLAIIYYFVHQDFDYWLLNVEKDLIFTYFT